MRRCIKYSIMLVLAFGVLLAAFTGTATAAVDDVDESTWTTWPSTIYYLAYLSGPDGPYEDITVYITAVDEYTLYVNGLEWGKGVHKDPSTGKINVDKHTVSIGKLGSGKGFKTEHPTIIIGVEVRNKGIGNGNGLMVDIKANSDWLGTSTLSRRTHVINVFDAKEGWEKTREEYGVAWYYHSGDVKSEVYNKAELGEDWYDLPIDFFVEIMKHGFKRVMLGQMRDIGYQPNENSEIITGYPGDVDIGASEDGSIRLRSVVGENLAFKQPSEEVKLTDGDLFNGYNIAQQPVGITKFVDLEEIRRINKMVLFTGGTNPNNWVRDSVRGYSVEISNDQFQYDEVGILHEIGVNNADEGDYDWYAISFPEEWTRYVRFKITEARTYPFKPNIGEMMVFGTGYVYDGSYESGWNDAGDPLSLKNYDIVNWSGNIPEGTEIKIQTKTKYENADGLIVESDWSTDHTDTSFVFDSPEPALGFKYRIKLSTQDIDITPELFELSVTYSDTAQPVSHATGYISPSRAPMGEMSDFEYTIEYDLNAGQNIKSIALYVPGESSVDSVLTVNGVLTSSGYNVDSTTDTLYIDLNSAITGGVEIKLYFKSTLYAYAHDFNAYILNSSNNDEAGMIKVWENSDPEKTMTVKASTLNQAILSNVKAVPKVFTPNNDTKNDFTVIEFSIGKVAINVSIKIFDTKGRLVYVRDHDKLEATDHFIRNKAGNAAAAELLPGYWNGEDEDGDLVPPGVYIYQVVVDADSGEKVEGGTVVVAY